MSNSQQSVIAPPYDARIEALDDLERIAELALDALADWSDACDFDDKDRAACVHEMILGKREQPGLYVRLRRHVTQWKFLLPASKSKVIKTPNGIKRPTTSAAIASLVREFLKCLSPVRKMAQADDVDDDALWAMAREVTEWCCYDWQELKNDVDAETTDGREKIWKKYDWSKPNTNPEAAIGLTMKESPEAETEAYTIRRLDTLTQLGQSTTSAIGGIREFSRGEQNDDVEVAARVLPDLFGNGAEPGQIGMLPALMAVIGYLLPEDKPIVLTAYARSDERTVCDAAITLLNQLKTAITLAMGIKAGPDTPLLKAAELAEGMKANWAHVRKLAEPLREVGYDDHLLQVGDAISAAKRLVDLGIEPAEPSGDVTAGAAGGNGSEAGQTDAEGDGKAEAAEETGDDVIEDAIPTESDEATDTDSGDDRVEAARAYHDWMTENPEGTYQDFIESLRDDKGGFPKAYGWLMKTKSPTNTLRATYSRYKKNKFSS